MTPQTQTTETQASTGAAAPAATPATTPASSAPHMTQSLAELQASIVADGVIDAKEAGQIRERVFADNSVDKAEAGFLFALNDATTGKANSPRWNALFVEAVSAFVLEDDATPGAVDEAEGAFLVSHIQGDGQVDANEKALLANVWVRATSIPAGLQSLIDSTFTS